MRVRADLEISHLLGEQEEYHFHKLQLPDPDHPLCQPGRGSQPWGGMNAIPPKL